MFSYSLPNIVTKYQTALLHLLLFNMLTKKNFNIALVGNPNCGKSTLFNTLTGLHQKTGNFPGVTVDKKTGTILFQDNYSATLIDLPGTYSLYPRY